MKTIPFDENARDVWHDAKEELPDTDRNVIVGHEDGSVGFSTIDGWPYFTFTHWRELPAPPRPTLKIVPHSINHWHDPKVERPEAGRRIVVMHRSGMAIWYAPEEKPNLDKVAYWSYYPDARPKPAPLSPDDFTHGEETCGPRPVEITQ